MICKIKISKIYLMNNEMVEKAIKYNLSDDWGLNTLEICKLSTKRGSIKTKYCNFSSFS